MELVRVPSTFLFLAHCWLALWDMLQICLGAQEASLPTCDLGVSRACH